MQIVVEEKDLIYDIKVRRDENMYEKVLFPTDFSEQAHKTLDCIKGIPGIRYIVLLHVIDATRYPLHGQIREKEIEDSKARLDEQRQYIKSLGLDVKWKVEVITSSNITNEILKIAEDEKISLIVMNARGKGIVSGLLLGSTSLDVIRHATTDVLIIKNKLTEPLEAERFEKFCPSILSKVLYPTDFSESAGNALSFLKSMGVQYMILMHVVTKGETKEGVDNYITSAKDRLDAIKNVDNSNVDTCVRVGDPAEEICAVAEDEDMSVIAMPSHNRNWLEELLVGSVTFDVIKRAKIPVLVMRQYGLKQVEDADTHIIYPE